MWKYGFHNKYPALYSGINVNNLTREEAAQYLSISLGTLWSWTKKGLFTSRRLGNKIYYLKADLKNAVQII